MQTSGFRVFLTFRFYISVGLHLNDSVLCFELKCFFWMYSLNQTLMLFFSLLFPLQQTLLCSAVEEVSVLSYYVFIVTSFWDVRWFLHGFDSRKHIVVHWRMESEVSNHVWGCPCGRLMAKHYQGPHLDTFLHTLWRDCSNYTQSTRHDRRGREVSGYGVMNQPNYNWNFDTPHFYRGIRLVPR